MESEEARRAFGAGRVSQQRSTIALVAGRMNRAFTVDSLISSARAEDASIGVATVYRAVSAMEKSGWLERVGQRTGSALYARCAASGHHHHHLICTDCGHVAPAACPLERIGANAESADGFVVTSHEVTLYGLCAECVPARKG